MKYHRLTDSQFIEMHHEFAIFLASNSIDKTKWDRIKETELHTVDLLLDGFSDLVWEKILTQCSNFEFATKDQLFLFNTRLDEVETLIVKVVNVDYDLTTSKGFEWVLKNIHSQTVSLFHATRAYSPSRNEFIYSYLRKGAVLSEGIYFKELKSYFFNSIK
ncbi:DUF6495 family protein [Flavobacteriaceae bacterium]|nr:DUF6495 family protein [Flavobacteriaceae bacterium]